MSEGSLTPKQAAIKRTFDFCMAAVGIALFWWLILISWIISSYETRSNGLFIQNRVGMHGKIFKVVKIKTMRHVEDFDTTITQKGDPRITRSGQFFRLTKIDELPQLWNVLIGDMSLVGPRPDMPGYADVLKGKERMILNIRPGITGPATLKYRDEEALLAKQADPLDYNDRVIFPDKVRINIEYIQNYSFPKDISLILRTIFS